MSKFTEKKPRAPRRPDNHVIDEDTTARLWNDCNVCIPFVNICSTAQLKKLHAWLGRVIAWREYNMGADT